jgi:hypothetical protein
MAVQSKSTYFEAIPAWQVVKSEIVQSLYRAENYLNKYWSKNASCEFHKLQKETYFAKFVSEILSLYMKLRPKLERIKKSKKDKVGSYKGLQELDKSITNPKYSSNKQKEKWIKIYFEIVNAVEDLGITKIELKLTPPELAYLEGLEY